MKKINHKKAVSKNVEVEKQSKLKQDILAQVLGVGSNLPPSTTSQSSSYQQEEIDVKKEVTSKMNELYHISSDEDEDQSSPPKSEFRADPVMESSVSTNQKLILSSSKESDNVDNMSLNERDSDDDDMPPPSVHTMNTKERE
jgi:hypothetical protein